MRYGLLGRKLGHSHAPRIHRMFGLDDYRLFEVEPGAVEPFLRSGTPGGINVTIPYKKVAFSCCDELSDTGRRIGNVNTLLFKDGKIHGDNTDYAGLSFMARRAGIALKDRYIVILGSGGAAQTAALLAQDEGARHVVRISRSGEDNYNNLERHKGAQVIINATPVGMYPDNEGLPVSTEGFPRLQGVLDMVYNPLRTRLVLEAKSRGIAAAGGLSMLVEQARIASCLFQGKDIPPQETQRVLSILYHELENIVLIGMPGAGKSVVGREIARLLNRKFVDTDQLVLEKTGRPPADIIVSDGEEAFRHVETQVLLAAARESGIVLSTGGGAVLRKENRTALRQTGRLYWLRRPLHMLAVTDRPLSRDFGALYKARKPIYRAAADCEIDAAGPAREAARRIVEEFNEHTGD
ncbi:MAG: shikimate kinase [Christensenellales bacterium]|jgi:shikimate dehydrogenase